MAFRIRQKMFVSTANQIRLPQLEMNEQTGIGEVVSVKQCVELPKPETMELGLMVKAGVPLNEVDTKLLDPDCTGLVAELSKEEPKDDDKKE